MSKCLVKGLGPVSLASLETSLREQKFLQTPTQWVALSGGRSNRVWRVSQAGAHDLCVKLYPQTEWQNPLFANDPAREYYCLENLHAEKLCPKPLGLVETPQGRCLVYLHHRGVSFSDQTAPVGQLLGRIHSRPAVPAYSKAIRHAPCGSSELNAHTVQILQRCEGPERALLERLRPAISAEKPKGLSLIHTDPVANNIVISGQTALLIDWQSPALGDPMEDLCHFLSPAMQKLYRGKILNAQQQRQVLNAYQAQYPRFDFARFERLYPHYSWRIAAYCLWQKLQGNSDYSDAFDQEVAALKVKA